MSLIGDILKESCLSFVTPEEKRNWDKASRNESKRRKCLRCGAEFLSVDRGNRICSRHNASAKLRNDDYKFMAFDSSGMTAKMQEELDKSKAPI